VNKHQYQIRRIGEPAGNVANENLRATCTEWAESPKGKEVIAVNLFTNEVHAFTTEESQSNGNEYNRLRIG
jgi:hypothetical protein